jgi:hypothetical protein
MAGKIPLVSTALSLGQLIAFACGFLLIEQDIFVASNSALVHDTAEHFSAHSVTELTFRTLSKLSIFWVIGVASIRL